MRRIRPNWIWQNIIRYQVDQEQTHDRTDSKTYSLVLWRISGSLKNFPDIQFNEGLPDKSHHTKDTLLIIDDLMCQQNQKTTELFTKHSHHIEVSVVFITQNFFHEGGREMTLNAQYIVLMKNPRDVSQIHHLAGQMYPKNSKFMIEACKDATSASYSYLFIDLRQETDDKHRLRANVFPGETNFAYLHR